MHAARRVPVPSWAQLANKKQIRVLCRKRKRRSLFFSCGETDFFLKITVEKLPILQQHPTNLTQANKGASDRNRRANNGVATEKSIRLGWMELRDQILVWIPRGNQISL